MNIPYSKEMVPTVTLLHTLAAFRERKGNRYKVDAKVES